MIKKNLSFVIDSSVLGVFLFNEPDTIEWSKRLEKAKRIFISPINYVEISMVAVHRTGGMDDLMALMKKLKIKIVATNENQAFIAREAFQRYGKGRHEARLNLGDCFAYALAKDKDLPLLAKGNDFRRTDVKLA